MSNPLLIFIFAIVIISLFLFHFVFEWRQHITQIILRLISSLAFAFDSFSLTPLRAFTLRSVLACLLTDNCIYFAFFSFSVSFDRRFVDLVFVRMATFADRILCTHENAMNDMRSSITFPSNDQKIYSLTPVRKGIFEFLENQIHV